MRTIGIGLILVATTLAAPAAWGQQGPGRGRGGFDGAMLLSQKSVQEELKLSDEQTKQLTEQAAKQREAFGEFRDLSREERQKRMTEAREQNQKMVATVLNEEQQKRLRQITLQLQGAQALASPDVAASLDLSDEQKKSIEEIQTASREEMRAAFQAGGDDREAARKKFQEARQATGDKLKAVLTAEQQTKWQELLGEPFKGELRGPGGPGQGQRRRNRDGAAIERRDAARTVLTADRQDGETKTKGDAKKEGAKPEKSARQGDKPRKKPGQKHAGKRGQPSEQQARHHRGQHGPRAMQARHSRGGHGPAAYRQHGDARSEAWSKVARAMGHQDRQRSFSHHGRRGHHGHPGFHAARAPYGRYAQAHRMPGSRQMSHRQADRRHFAGVSRYRHHGGHHGMASHQFRRPPHAFHGYSRDAYRGGSIASHRYHGPSRHGHHGGWHRGHQPGEHGFHAFAQRSHQHGPPSWIHGHHGLRHGAMAHQRGHHGPHRDAVASRGDHGPPRMHGFHHRGPMRMHMIGFKHHRDADRSKGDGEDNHVRKDRDRKGKTDAAKDKEGKAKSGKDVRQGRAKRPSRGDSAPSQPDGPKSERQDDRQDD